MNIERMKNAEFYRCLWEIFDPNRPAKPDDETGGLFLTVPLKLSKIWTTKELRELSKQKAAPPEEKKRKITFKRSAKPKFGRAGEDHNEGAGGLL